MEKSTAENLLWMKLSDAWTIFQGEINEIFQEYLKLMPEFISTATDKKSKRF